MENNKNTELNEILEGLHYGQVVEFKCGGVEYALESYKLEGNDYHSLCLYKFNKDDRVGTLVFADKITYFGESDYPIKFKDNYPIEEIKTILEKEKVFNGKSFIDAFEDIELSFID